MSLALEHPDAQYDPEKHQPKDVLINFYKQKLENKSEMLEDFFALKFSHESADAES